MRDILEDVHKGFAGAINASRIGLCFFDFCAKSAMVPFMSILEKLAGYFSHQEETRLLWPPVFIAIGIALYFSLMTEPSYAATGGFLAGGAILAMGGRRLYARRSGDVPVYLLYLVLSAFFLVALGFALSQLRAYTAGTPMILEEGRPAQLEGSIAHMEVQENGKGMKILLEDVAIEKKNPDATPRRVRMTVRTKMPDNLEVGDRIKFLARLMPLAPPAMPGAYDYARHFYFEGVGGTGFALSPVTLVAKNTSWTGWLESSRMRLADKVGHVVTGPSQGIVIALMTGERAAIADDDWQALRASGLAHIISISGLHVAMVAAPVFFLVRLFLAMIPALALRYDIKKIAACVALAACTAYVGFVVPSVPTTRALLMTGVGLYAIMIDRSPFSMRLVGLSAILVLVITPESLWSASFQMSFAAVTALVAVADWMRPLWIRLRRDGGFIRRVLLYLVGAIITSFVASIATAPFVLYHFQQNPTYSVLGNLMAMPLSGLVIMPGIILSYILLPLGVGDGALMATGWGVDRMLDVARFVEALPGAVTTGKMLPPLVLYMATLGGLALILCRGQWKLLSLIPLAAAMVVSAQARAPDVLVSAKGELVLLREGERIFLSSIKKEKFIREEWIKRLGATDQDPQPFPREGRIILSEGASIGCDRAACRIATGAQKISFGKSYAALVQDCGWADILVTSVYLSKDFCPQARMIDGRFLSREGAVAIYKGDNRIETVAARRGIRPWTRGIEESRKAPHSSVRRRPESHEKPAG